VQQVAHRLSSVVNQNVKTLVLCRNSCDKTVHRANVTEVDPVDSQSVRPFAKISLARVSIDSKKESMYGVIEDMSVSVLSR
jgi:hypothetical protein